MYKNNVIMKKEKEKVLILYDSLFGNSKKVAISLSRGLEEGGILVDCSSIREFEVKKITSYHVIGLGGPTHNRNMSKPMKAFLSKIRSFSLVGKKAFAFETKLDVPFAGSSGKNILKSITKMKMNVLHPLITGIVTAQEGPLTSNTLNNMEEIGLEIADILYNQNK